MTELELRRATVEQYLSLLPKNVQTDAEMALIELTDAWAKEADRRVRAYGSLRQASRIVGEASAGSTPE